MESATVLRTSTVEVVRGWLAKGFLTIWKMSTRSSPDEALSDARRALVIGKLRGEFEISCALHGVGIGSLG